MLSESYLINHPTSEFVILSLDASPPDATPDRRVTWLDPTDVMEEEAFEELAVMYDVTELATAVKPFLLDHLVSSLGGPWIYLDPDILVISQFQEVEHELSKSSIVLTPHNLEPITRDGMTPDELHILRSGAYNLGFIGLHQSAEEFLGWWSERLRRDCLISPFEGYFVDQRWLDLAPSYFDIVLLRHPGYNIAYWNLWQRPIRVVDGSLTVLDEQVRFLHFSGFDIDSQQTLSKHMGRSPRIRVDDVPEWQRIADEYRRRLLEAGHDDYKSSPYGFASLPNGDPLDVLKRRAYRQALIDFEAGVGEAPPRPLQQPDEFMHWYRKTGHYLSYKSVEWSYRIPPHIRRALNALVSKPRLFGLVGNALSLAHRAARRLGFTDPSAVKQQSTNQNGGSIGGESHF